MGHLNENNGMFPNFVNVRFWHKADVQALVDLLYSLIQSF